MNDPYNLLGHQLEERGGREGGREEGGRERGGREGERERERGH